MVNNIVGREHPSGTPYLTMGGFPQPIAAMLGLVCFLDVFIGEATSCLCPCLLRDTVLFSCFVVVPVVAGTELRASKLDKCL